MTPTEYRKAIADLGLSQRGAARAMFLSERTSRRYALKGVPSQVEARVRMQLEQLSRSKQNQEGSEK